MQSWLGVCSVVAEGLTVRTGVTLIGELSPCIHRYLGDSLGRVGMVAAVVRLSQSLAIVTEDRVFKVAKGNEDCSDVVERPPQQTVLYEVVNAETR